MSTSNSMRFPLHLGALSAVPLVALALGASPLHARSLERPGSQTASRNARDCGGPAATESEPAAATTTQSAAPASKNQVAPGAASPSPATSEEADLTASGARGGAVSRTPSTTRGKSSAKPGNRVMRRSGEGRVVPPTPAEEPRRGGVGTLIGITFA